MNHTASTSDAPSRREDRARPAIPSSCPWMPAGGSRALIVLFAAFLALPFGRWLILKPDAQLEENRNLAPAPDFRRDSLRELPNKIDAYYNDHVGFRNSLVRIAALVAPWIPLSSRRMVVVGKSPVPGDPPWLFYSARGILEDRFGLRPLSDVQLEAWKQRLERRTAWLAERKILYRFVIVPEKSAIYPELLPDYMRSQGPSMTRTDQLIQYLRTTGSPVRILDLRDSLRKAKTDGYVYYPYDTHWNGRGFFAGYREIFTDLQTSFPEWKPQELGRDYELKTVSGTAFQDLRSMLGQPRVPRSDPLLARLNVFRIRREAAEWPAELDPLPPGVAAYVLANSGADRRLLAFHDSFFWNGIVAPEDQPLAAHFSRSYFCGIYPGDETMRRLVEIEQPDVVLEERVERELENIALDPPAEPATPDLMRTAAVPRFYLDTISDRPPGKDPVIFSGRRTTLKGWAVDPTASAAASGVEVAIDNVVLPAAYGYPRQDVTDALRCQACLHSGFEVEIPPGALAAGKHRLAVRVILSDKKSYGEAIFGDVEVRPLPPH